MPTMLVLGATSGIARATARAFAGSGWTLQLAGRDIQRLQEVADDCGGASIFPFDVLDPASRSALWGLLPSCPDAVLCAVGLLGDQDCACRDPKAALQVIECNFTGLVPVLLQAAEAFEARGSGLLIGLSEEGFENREGVMLMTGTLRLAEVWELVRKTIEQAVPGVSLGDVSAEYHLAGYPLVMLDATLTATESLPVGRRF